MALKLIDNNKFNCINHAQDKEKKDIKLFSSKLIASSTCFLILLLNAANKYSFYANTQIWITTIKTSFLIVRNHNL